MVKSVKKSEISILDLSGREILKYKSPTNLDHQQLLQKAVIHAAENRIPLNNANLKGIVLNNADISGLVLDGADLSGGIIKGSNLDNVSLLRANASQTKIINTCMERSYLDGCAFNFSVFHKVNAARSSIISTSFYGAQIRASNLSGCHALVGLTSFEGAFVQNTSLKQMVLDNLYCPRASFVRSDMAGLSFATGQFQSTKFNLVNLADSKLNFMHGQDTIFINSNLNHAEIKNDHLLKFTINEKAYGRINILESVVRHLEEQNFSFVNEPTQSKRLEMMKAIKNKDQKLINSLITDHRYNYGDHTHFDMQASSFKGHDLSGLKFQHVDFSGSDFSGADLTNTTIVNSIADGVFIFDQGIGQYKGLNLSETSARNTYFTDVNLDGAIFYESDLSYSQFDAVIADRANLSSTILYGAQMRNRTAFTNTDFSEALFNHATAKNVTMRGNYNNAEIHSTHFEQVDASGSIFEKSDIKFTNFISSDFSDANFKGNEPKNLHTNDVDFSGGQFQGFKPFNSEFKSTDFSNVDATGSFFKSSILHDVHLHNAEMLGATYVDTKITMSDVSDALNPGASMFVAAGKTVKTEVCNKEQSQVYLDQIKSLLKEKAPKPDNCDFDASM